MCASGGRFLEAYEVEPLFDEVRPLPVQIGGVARSDGPCLARYRRRA